MCFIEQEIALYPTGEKLLFSSTQCIYSKIPPYVIEMKTANVSRVIVYRTSQGTDILF